MVSCDIKTAVTILKPATKAAGMLGNTAQSNSVVVAFKDFEKIDRAMFIHHWLIALCITGEQHATVESAPVFKENTHTNNVGQSRRFYV